MNMIEPSPIRMDALPQQHNQNRHLSTLLQAVQLSQTPSSSYKESSLPLPMTPMTPMTNSLLQSRHAMMQRIYSNKFAAGLPRDFLEQPSFGVSKKEMPRITKAHKVFKNDLRRKQTSSQKGPLPPPPALVTLKDWEKIKRRLNSSIAE